MVVGQIATTAHSRVWEATDSDGQHVAVKELKAHRIVSDVVDALLAAREGVAKDRLNL